MRVVLCLGLVYHTLHDPATVPSLNPRCVVLLVIKVVFSTETDGKIKADGIKVKITGQSNFQLSSKTSAGGHAASDVEFGALLPGGARTGELTSAGYRQGYALGKNLSQKYQINSPNQINTR